MPVAKKRYDKKKILRSLADTHAEREAAGGKRSREENAVEKEEGNVSTGMIHEHNSIP